MAEDNLPHKKKRNRKIRPLPEFKVCIECGGDPKPRAEFYISKDKTSTGRPKLKLAARCKSCRRSIWSREHPKKPRVKHASPRKLPIDQPKFCPKCGALKSPDEFGKRNRNGYIALASRCIPCARTPSEQQKIYDGTRRQRVKADPERNARHRAYSATKFQANKERIRLRNIEARRREPEKVRLRAIANVMRRRAFGCDKSLPEVRAAVSETLDAYRIGDQYWDVYESRLIDAPTIDHLTAVTRGGTNSADNLTVTSRSNNSSKSTLPLIVWLAKRAARLQSSRSS